MTAALARLQRDAAMYLLSRLPLVEARCAAEQAEARQLGDLSLADGWVELRDTLRELKPLAEAVAAAG